MSRRALALILTVTALTPVGCSNDEPAAGEARLEVDGRAIVERGDAEEEVVDGRTDVGPGDRVEVTDGVATMALRDGVRFELRAGLGDAADTRLRMGEVPDLEAGDLLVSAPESTTVEAARTTITVRRGAAQVSRSLGMGVAAYDGVVELDSAGQERPVPALREMRVPALGRPPHAPRPLDYDEQDPWDRRFLGAAIDLGDRLADLATGYTNNLNPGEGRTPGFFRLVLPGLDDEPEFGAELLDVDRPPGETLVGAAITELGRRGGFAERWSSVFSFRDAGARWGLVALDQDVSGTPLLGSIEQAVSSSPLAFAAPAPRGPAPPRSSTPTTTGPTPSPTSPPPTAPPPTSPPTTEPPPPDPVSPILDPVLEPGTDPVMGLVDGLLGLLDPSPGG